MKPESADDFLIRLTSLLEGSRTEHEGWLMSEAAIRARDRAMRREGEIAGLVQLRSEFKDAAGFISPDDLRKEITALIAKLRGKK